jgi:hypothetical protein
LAVQKSHFFQGIADRLAVSDIAKKSSRSAIGAGGAATRQQHKAHGFADLLGIKLNPPVLGDFLALAVFKGIGVKIAPGAFVIRLDLGELNRAGWEVRPPLPVTVRVRARAVAADSMAIAPAVNP